MLRNIPLRTATTVVLALITLALIAIAVLGYQVFIVQDQQDTVPQFATKTAEPTVTPSRTLLALPTLTQAPTLAPVTATPVPAPAGNGQPALSGDHPPIEPTDQPCENCHQDLRGGN